MIILSENNWLFVFLISSALTTVVLPRFGTSAPSDLQPHYGNGFFGNVYLLFLDNAKR